jgi:hypothetical protein
MDLREFGWLGDYHFLKTDIEAVIHTQFNVNYNAKTAGSKKKLSWKFNFFYEIRDYISNRGMKITR